MVQNLKLTGKMAITKNEVNLKAEQLIEDLNNGLTWLKKDDIGYGSIETKYGANPIQIMAIRKHPDLKDVDTTVTIFNIIGLNKTNENTTSTKGTSSNGSNNTVEREVALLDGNIPRVDVPTNEAADIFANL
jgi:hypothetical protein